MKGATGHVVYLFILFSVNIRKRLYVYHSVLCFLFSSYLLLFRFRKEALTVFSSSSLSLSLVTCSETSSLPLVMSPQYACFSAPLCSSALADLAAALTAWQPCAPTMALSSGTESRFDFSSCQSTQKEWESTPACSECRSSRLKCRVLPLFEPSGKKR